MLAAGALFEIELHRELVGELVITAYAEVCPGAGISPMQNLNVVKVTDVAELTVRELMQEIASNVDFARAAFTGKVLAESQTGTSDKRRFLFNIN